MATNQVNGDVNAEHERLKQYKNVAKHEDMRRRRTECSVELRKQKRDEALMKRRNIANDTIESESCTEDESSKLPADLANAGTKPLTIPEIVIILQSNPSIEQLRTAFEAVRRILSRSNDAPIDEVIRSGLITALVQALYVEDEKVRFEAAWGLTNIVSGTHEQTMAVVKEGAIEPLLVLCKSPSLLVSEQACWAVANIVGEGAETRDLVLKAGILDAIRPLCERLDSLSVTFARTLAWLQSNLCRLKNPPVDAKVLRIVASNLKKFLLHEDKTVRQDSCWALAYLTDGNDSQVSLALEYGCVGPVVNMLKSSKESEIAPALRVLGNFATGSDNLTQVVIDNGVLSIVKDIMAQTRSQSLIKECCWLLSNVIAGTQSQINAVIKAGLISPIVDALQNGDNRSQVEASWAIANLSQGGQARQILQLAEKEYIKVFCDVLSPSSHVDLLVNTLETMFFLLTTLSNQESKKMSLATACDHIEEFDGLTKLEQLQEHANVKVYEAAYKIIERFFQEDSNDDEKIDLSPDNHFEF